MSSSKIIIALLICLSPTLSMAQLTSIDHWETAVFETDTWDYFLGFSAPPANWNQPGFIPTNWSSGPGGIGYADGDDNTTISPTLSVFMRLDFNIVDTSTVLAAILHADFDDAFVAYLNGHEIARSNIGVVGIPPLHTDPAFIYKEAKMYQGENPDAFLLVKSDLNQYLNQGSNTLAVQVHNNVITSSDMTARFFFSVGLSDNSMNYSPTPSWFTTPFVASHLPLLKINTNGQNIPDGFKITADLEVINNASNVNFIDDIPNEYNGKIGIEIRGASSTTFDKKGYGFETRDSLGNNNNVSLLGMPSENDWVLHGPYADKSLLRNFLTYHIGSQLSGYTPQVRFCEVFLDNQYWGVYLLKEKIKRDDERVDIAKLTPIDTIGDELTGGYIFKIDRDLVPNEGWYSLLGYGFFEYHHPNYDDLHPSQRAYLKSHFNTFEQLMASNGYNNPVNGYSHWLDVPSFIDYMMIQEITRDIDAFRLSTFMYKEKNSDGGKIFAGPIWDHNLSYGNEDFCDNGDFDGWAFQYNQACGAPFPVFWGKLANDAAFRDDFNCRWQQLRGSTLNTDTIMHLIDSMVVFLGDAQVRNFERWNILGNYVWPNSYVGQDYADEITFLKNWITQRLNWMETNMIGTNQNCFPVNTNEQEINQTFKIYPNPFTDYLSLENSDNKSITIEIYDMVGRMVQSVNLNATDSYSNLNTSDLEAGFYFYSVYEDNKLITSGKLLKSN